MSNDVSWVVRPVESKRQWRQFFELRRLIYHNDPNAVFPLRFMEKNALDGDRNPFFQHATRRAFLCYRDEKPIGRIVAIHDRLHNQYHSDRVGFFGFFECIDHDWAAVALLNVARDWLIRQGCDRIRGPVNPSMKSDFGVLVKGNDDPPFVLMGYTPKYYERLMFAAGLEIVREFYAYMYDVPSTKKIAKESEKEIVQARQRILGRYPQLKIGGTTPHELDRTMREINRIGNTIRSEGWGFVPLTDAELTFMIAQLRRVLNPEKVLVAYWEDELVGYCVNVPDINWALRKAKGKYDWIRLPQFLYWLKKTDRTRVVAIGADKRYRRKGVGILMSTEMRVRGFDDPQFRQWEFSWVDSENVNSIRNIQRTMPVEQYKTLRLYEKRIAD